MVTGVNYHFPSTTIRIPVCFHKGSRLLKDGSIRSGSCPRERALRGLVPDAIRNRKKIGFAISLASGFRKELKEFAADAILNPQSDGLLDAATVRKIWNEHQIGLRVRPVPLCAALMFRLWQREFCG